MLAEAAAAPSAEHRSRTLQRLGDVSLFVAGFFAQSFARKLVDIDYHIAMGGRAYGTLAGSCGHGSRGRALSAVFAELAAKFQRLVDALNDVSEMSHAHSDRDLLRQYEIWLKTGSPRAHEILRRLGVDADAGAARAGAELTAAPDAALLRGLQGLLARIYDAPAAHDVDDFLVTDAARAAAAAGRTSAAGHGRAAAAGGR